jgi:hypothetical protein
VLFATDKNVAGIGTMCVVILGLNGMKHTLMQCTMTRQKPTCMLRLDGSPQVPRHQQTRDSLMDHILARLDMDEWDGAPVR